MIVKTFFVVGRSKRVVLQVLQAIRSFSNEKSIVLGDGDTPVLRWSTLCSRHIPIDLGGTQDDILVAQINSLVQQFPQAVLIPADCDAIRAINRVTEHLHVSTIPIPDLATVNMLDNKWSFYEFCVERNFNVPASIFVGSKFDIDFDAVVDQLGLPFVLKPINEAGSNGVHIVRSKAYFEEHIHQNGRYQFDALIAQRYIA